MLLNRPSGCRFRCVELLDSSSAKRLSATSRAIRAVRRPLVVHGARHRLFHSNTRLLLSAHDPFGEDSPLGPELKRMQQQMLENPELLSSVMDSPMMQQMMQNPEMFGRMIQMHPQMATVLEQNPQLKAMMAEPWLLDPSVLV